MKKRKLSLRHATSADFPAITLLLDRAFEPKGLEQRTRLWRWRYDANPARIPDMPGFLVAEKGGRIVAVHGLTPMRVKVGERRYCAACSCDFAVDPSARSAGMKIKLKALSKEISPLPISTSANEQANRITLSLGGREVSKGRRSLLKPLKAGGFVRKMVAGKAGAVGQTLAGMSSIVAGKPLDWLLGIRRAFQSFSRVPNAEIQSIHLFDQRFDDFWERVSKEYSILVVRNASYLNWRYMNYPFSGVASYGLFSGDELLGFAVIHNHVDEDGLRFVAILELFVPKGETAAFQHLLGEIIRRAARGGADYITAKTSVAEWEALFKRHGFMARDSSFSPVTYKNNTDLSDELFAEDRNWYLSLGDGDFCYYF